MNSADDFRVLRGVMPEANNVVGTNPKAEDEANRHIAIIVAALIIAERVMTPGFMARAASLGAMVPNGDKVEAAVRKALTAREERRLDG